MSSPFKRRRARAVIAASGLGLVIAPLTLLPAAHAATGTHLVISEVYGGGGATTGSPSYAADFVELYNPTDSPIPLTGLSLQYRSASYASTSAPSVAALSDQVVPPNDHFLVQVSTGSLGPALPKPDLVTSSALNLAAANGQVLLAKSTTPFTTTGDLAGNTALVDMVGYGTATSFETANTGTSLTSTSSAQRSDTGADTDSNRTDFSAATPTPRAATGATTPPAPEQFTGTIAEIQGTDTDTSPHEGEIATTRGVVTAAYPTGGFNGFYIQTPGTGGTDDATPGASDAVFVYGSAATAAVRTGDYVQVAGQVKEFNGTTEIVPATARDVTVLPDTVTAPAPLATRLPATDAAREAHEGELVAPEGPFTVTNTYATNSYGEIGLAAGTTPLTQPTEVADAQDTAAVAAVEADNAARAVTLDDGASANYTGAAKDTPMPWLSTANPVRVGARVTFTGPVVLEYRNSLWKLQPTTQVRDDGHDTATFANTRTDAPDNVGGSIRLATFNVLNYFPTTGAEFVAGGLGTCTYYKDRAGNPITVKDCTPNGPRGAADAENLARQQAKIVSAVNRLGASIVSLEEIENSVQFGKDRDFAVSRLVDALNAAAGSRVWAYAPSPAPGDLPTPAQEDVIRTAFIYKPADVALVGGSRVLVDEENFDNAREPLAQAFKPAGAPDSKAFAVIVNHFKSKGSGVDDGTGQGLSNPDRIGQANAVAAFAESFATDRHIKPVFLTGDFNSYSMEDPMQVLYADGYTPIESSTPGEETYSFSGLSGSLDHVLANNAAAALVTGADIWNINSPESVGFEYSRYNNNATDLYRADPFRASDHDPEIVGIDTRGRPGHRPARHPEEQAVVAR